MSRIHGIVRGIDGSSFGIEIRDATVESHASQVATARDESGKQTEAHLVSVRKVLRINGFASGSRQPEPGDVVTHSGEDYLITSSTLHSESGGFQTCRIVAERWDDASIGR